jgi:hypothetical protein
MLEFIQSYGIWIFVGLLFSLMLWGHTRRHGMGLCGGHQYEHEAVKKDEQPGHQIEEC